MSIHFEVDITDAMVEIDRLIKGPDAAGFESAMLAGFMAASAKVHVITGYLKANGHTSSSLQGGQWEGTIGFPRYPGIFELARKDTPTMNHPEGGHDFLNSGPGEVFVKGVQEAMADWVTGGAGGLEWEES